MANDITVMSLDRDQARTCVLDPSEMGSSAFQTLYSSPTRTPLRSHGRHPRPAHLLAALALITRLRCPASGKIKKGMDDKNAHIVCFATMKIKKDTA